MTQGIGAIARLCQVAFLKEIAIINDLQSGGPMIRFFARMPAFPILVETDNRVVPITSSNEFQILSLDEFSRLNEIYKVVDSKGEGWGFFPSGNILTPLAFPKIWTKQQAIDFVNSSNPKRGSYLPFSIKSLSSITFSKLIIKLVEYLKTTESEASHGDFK